MSTRQLAAIMFTDMVGFTALMQVNETLAIEKRNLNNNIIEGCLNKHNGRLLQNYGDGTLSIHTSAVNAIHSAIEMQTLSRQQKIDLRIGLHIGDVLTDDNGIYGDSVNVASRIESLAVPGSIFISEKLNDELKNQDKIKTKPLGYFELKNVLQPVQVYAVISNGIVNPGREEVRGKLKESLNAIAVLPFVSLSTDPENEYFCDGITEELLNVLAGLEGLQVTSRTSAFAFKGKQEDIREIAAKLNVQKILEGSVRKSGDRVRITAQLINATDGYHLWSETYERRFEDIFQIQDDIAREIANKFRINLNEKDHTQELVKVATQNLDAYKKYLQGIHYWNRMSPETSQMAIHAFREATALDPEFPNPYPYLVWAYWFQGFWGMIPLQVAEARCREACTQAIKTDPDNVFTQLAIGIINLAYEWNWSVTEHALMACVEKNPNISMAYMLLSGYHRFMLQDEKAIEWAMKAYQLDPVGTETLSQVADLFLTTGHVVRAEKYIENSLKIHPEHTYSLLLKAQSHIIKNEMDKALIFIDRLQELYGEYPMILMNYAFVYARLGEKEKVKEILRKVQSFVDKGLSVNHELSVIYAILGEKDKFFEYYQKAIEEKSTNALWIYKSALIPAEFWNDNRFIPIRNKIGLPV